MTRRVGSSEREQKQKIRQDFAHLKELKRAFHKKLTILKTEHLEALQRGDKERDQALKQEIERLSADWRDRQRVVWRGIRRDQESLGKSHS